MSTQPASKRKRRKSISIDQQEQWDVVSSAIRFELLEFLHACGPCSIAELAAQLEVKPDSLYHHINKLLAVALIEETGQRTHGRTSEALFDVVAERFDFKTDMGTESLLKLMKSVHRRAERNFEKSLDAGIVKFGQRHRNAYVRGDTARFTSEGLANIRKHIDALVELFEEGRSSSEGKLYSLTLDLMPLYRDSAD